MGYRKWIIIFYFGACLLYVGAENISGHLRMAYEAHKRGLYSLSNTQIEKYIKDNPDAKDLDYAHLLSAVNYLHLDDIDKGIEELTLIRRLFPDSEFTKEVLSYLILAHLKKGDVATSVSFYSEYKEKFSSESFLELQIEQAVFARATALFNEGDIKKSKDLLDLFISEFKTSGYLPEVFYYRGLIQYQENDFTKAAEYLKQASALSSLIESREILADINLKLGDCFFNMKEYTSSEYFYNKVIKDFPDTLYSVWAYYQLSLLEKRKGNLQKAEEILEKVMGKAGTDLNLQILSELANIQMLQEQWADSEKYLHQITEQFPGSKDIPDVYLKLGFVNFNMSRFEESIECFKKTLNMPAAEDIKERGYFGLGYTYYAKKQYEDSIKTWNQLLMEFPDSKFEHEILFFTGKNYYESGDYPNAEKYFRQLVTKFPKSSFYTVACQMLIESLLKQGKLNESMRTCEGFFSSGAETNETISFLYGKTMYLLKDFRKAKEILEKLQNVNPAEDVERRFYLGKIYAYEGKTISAQEKFLEILSFYPDFTEWNKLAEEELKSLKK